MRVHRVVRAVPIAIPHVWLAALAALGEEVDLAAKLPRYPLDAGI